MDGHVVLVCKVVGVFLNAKPPKTFCEKPGFEWLVGGHKHVNSQIELLAANEQWVADVLADNVRFFARHLV